ISLGTPHYMSPEQATGDRAVDARTDIYSLGAVLYEMLTGDPPHAGTTAQAIIARVLTDKPRSMRLSRDTIPPHVDATVERALAKLPADRFGTARDFADALRGRSAASPFSNTATQDLSARFPPWLAQLRAPATIASMSIAAAAVVFATLRRSPGVTPI